MRFDNKKLLPPAFEKKFPDAVAATQAWLDHESHHLLTRSDPDYPSLLEDIPSPPEFLYVAGDIEALHLPTLAIVGSRNPTEGGRRNAFDFAHHLAASGFCISSGLAQGIDTAAHEGALKAGGRTVAFLGHGIDQVYPAANRELASKIAASGALVSEFPFGTPPLRENFPRRNRLISGLAIGTLVVEAAQRSGSLITARLAGEQGREVFAIPGSIHNPMAKGCHRLIRSGAKLVESADDIVGELGGLLDGLRAASGPEDGATDDAETSQPEHETLLNIMGHDPIGIDVLASESGLTIAELSSMLLILELEGRVERLSGGQFCALRRPDRSNRSPDTAR